MTPDQRPIIARAEFTGGLSIASGGSLNCAKFLKLIGALVVRVLGGSLEGRRDGSKEGDLDMQLVQAFCWDRRGAVPIHKDVVAQS
jgi:hypothetical protein